MSVKDDVLKFLLENKLEAVSGEEIASSLGVSRNAIWKAIKALRTEGYEIEAATNKGYTLVSDNNTLSEQGIRKHLNGNENIDLHILPVVDSTNNYIKRLAGDGSPEGVVAISEEQTAGKGRLGRKFESPKKTGIYMSILLRPTFSAEESLSITTIAAVATAKAIETVSGFETQIKWVNDIYMRERKVSGILTEASVNFESGKLEYAVLGIGINVKYPEGGFPDEISDIAGAVFEEECGDDIRCRIIAGIIDNFFEYYRKIPNSNHIEEYRSRSLLTGREISFIQGDEEKSGIVRDIDDDCHLLVEMPDGSIKEFSTGEVNIKKTFLKR
ncbi:MAG: biotin--[acetyl-CoA-carboxylase] ligase [Clostridia bacterium]|nr:biotin--[acetyl-CoA-carboxylase] ligase [Clostridia bacterium]